MRKGWVLAGIAVVALVVGAVTVTTLDSGGDEAGHREPAGAPAESPRLDAPEVRAADGPAPKPLDLDDVAATKREATNAHLSTVLYRLAEQSDGELSPEESSRITGLPATGMGS